MGRWISLLFLLVLGASAAGLPPHIQKLLRVLPFPNVTRTSVELPSPVEKNPAFNDEVSRLLSKTSPAMDVKMTPLMRSLSTRSNEPDFDALRNAARVKVGGFYQANREALSDWVWGVPALILLASFLCLILGQKGYARFLGRACFSLCRVWILGLSLITVLCFTLWQVNAWGLLPPGFWISPILSVLVSAGLLRLLDMNFPVWNATLMSFLSPLIACAIMLAWDKMMIFLR